MSEELKEVDDNVTQQEGDEEYDAMITVAKGGKNFLLVIASALASIAVIKALALGFPIPESVEGYITSGLIAFFSAIAVAASNWLKHRNLGVVTTVATAAAPAALEAIAGKVEQLKDKIKEDAEKKKTEELKSRIEQLENLEDLKKETVEKLENGESVKLLLHAGDKDFKVTATPIDGEVGEEGVGKDAVPVIHQDDVKKVEERMTFRS